MSQSNYLFQSTKRKTMIYLRMSKQDQQKAIDKAVNW